MKEGEKERGKREEEEERDQGTEEKFQPCAEANVLTLQHQDTSCAAERD